jgi:hypothetical protein
MAKLITIKDLFIITSFSMNYLFILDDEKVSLDAEYLYAGEGSIQYRGEYAFKTHRKLFRSLSCSLVQGNLPLE